MKSISDRGISDAKVWLFYTPIADLDLELITRILVLTPIEKVNLLMSLIV